VPDLLIRNVPAQDLHQLDEQARRVGLSRTEYLKRHLHREAQRLESSVTAADLSALADLVPDLGDADIMADAWS